MIFGQGHSLAGKEMKLSKLPNLKAGHWNLGESLYGAIRFYRGDSDNDRSDTMGLIAQMDAHEWDVLLEFVDHHRVAADFAHWINNVLEAQVPLSIQRSLVNSKLDGRKRDDELFVELKAIARILTEQNIPYVILKGAALIAAGYYRFPGQRLVMDIDLLVDREDLDRTYDALVGLGFSTELRLSRPIESYWNSKHLPPMVSDKFRYCIECHWKHFENTFQYTAPFDTREVLQYRVKVLLEGEPVYVPSTTHLLLSAFYHSQIFDAHAFTRSDNYRAMLDTSRMLEKGDRDIDWEFINERVIEKNYQANFEYFMARASNKYGGELPLFITEGESANTSKIWPGFRSHRGRRLLASTIVHMRELCRALSPKGRKERKQLLKANPDNWKYEPVYKQFLNPILLFKRLEFLFKRR